MKVFTDLEQWLAFRAGIPARTIGFVPTMGALHDGHFSLVQRAKDENEAVVVSLFVNPTQFDQAEDLEKYPQDVAADLRGLEKAGVTAVLLPDYKALYPDNYAYRICEKNLSRQLCGAHRPGHFDGVLTVVMKLLNLVRPQRAYFGEKDYQQLALIRGLVEAFFLPVEIVGCPIVREPDGLAMSSRNRRLAPAQRQQAARLFAILSTAPSAQLAQQQLQQVFDRVDYVHDLPGRRLAAVQLGAVRLIDNVPLPLAKQRVAGACR